MSDTCPWCSAPRESGLSCPRCGADYAKAAAIKAHGRASPGGDLHRPEGGAVHTDGVTDAEALPREGRLVENPELEYRFCLGAIPIALCIAVVFQSSGLGGSLQRIFLSMPVHELGHAVTAWFCGFSAIPTFWKTVIPESRGFIASLGLLGALVYMFIYSFRANRTGLKFAGGVLILLQCAGTFGIQAETARMLITFGGDGTGMMIATLLMGSFYFGKQTQLYKGSLRWGFLVIGAAAFVDIYATWWKARSDESAIPYGTTGGMATDAMKLVDGYGWSMENLVDRYVAVGAGCLIVLALVYVWGGLRAKSMMNAWQIERMKSEWSSRKQQTPS